jgi:riboflavin kinase/FMN adenylyltransferase
MIITRLTPGDVLDLPRAAIAVGNFDGVHRGHLALCQVTLERAAAQRGRPVVLTFDPHPARVLSPDRAPAELMTIDQKCEILHGSGIAEVVVVPFTPALSEQTPEEFARFVLEDALGAQTVVVGTHFRFGRNRQGNVDVLRELGGRLGFEVVPVEPVLHDGLPVSSSRIREAVARGDVEEAERMLGRPLFVDGRVVEGDGRGRALGIPTANLEVFGETQLARGVYAGRCVVPEVDPPGQNRCVVNVGHRPTFGGSTTTFEAHLLDFEGDLYGRRLRVELMSRLRDERRFESPEALAGQIRLDIDRARKLQS